MSVSPIPGSRVASSQSQIAVRGVALKGLGRIVVAGSRTGVDPGRLVPDSDVQGASFLPTRPFEPRESVTVRTGLKVRGGVRGSWHFAVAAPE